MSTNLNLSIEPENSAISAADDAPKDAVVVYGKISRVEVRVSRSRRRHRRRRRFTLVVINFGKVVEKLAIAARHVNVENGADEKTKNGGDRGDDREHHQSDDVASVCVFMCACMCK